MAHYDLAIVGTGIVGLAHALAAVRRGKRVVMFERDAQASGASIRNFGFVTATGQERGEVWRRAKRSCEIWREVAPEAGIPIEQEGLLVVARRPEALAVLEAFAGTEMGEGCRLLSPAQARERFPMLNGPMSGALKSPGELRVESRDAIPTLARWLETAWGVTILRETLVRSVAPPRIETSSGEVHAETCIVCPGDDLVTLFPDRIASYGVTRCKLHMMRTETAPWRLPMPVMSDLGIARYAGYGWLPEAEALRRRLAEQQGEAVTNGVHLIVVQSADGSLVIGDSHHYATTPDPFAPLYVDELILDEYRAVFGAPPPGVRERWIGTYASSDKTMFVDTPADAIRLVMITSGTGASTAFAIAEEVVSGLFGSQGASRSV